MIRRVLCPDCASRFILDPEDRNDGWLIRKTNIEKAKRPADEEENKITITGGADVTTIRIPDDVVACDSCNDNVFGKQAVAVSMWHQGDMEPVHWEQGFQG
jgi:hypothetical protein